MKIGNIGAGPGSNTVNRFTEMSSEDFLKVMFTELSQQDPLDPQDSGALLDQISTIRSIETDQMLMDRMNSLVDQNQFVAAGSLVGKHIAGLDEHFFPAEGLVESVVLEGSDVILALESGIRVPFGNVERIFNPDPDPDPGAGTTPGP